MDLRRFGELVNEARQRAGLTQQGLADEMSNLLSLLVSQQSVANWCRGRNLPGDRTTLLTLCQALYEAGGLTSLEEINEVLFAAEAGALHQRELEERFAALLQDQQHQPANAPNASPHIPPHSPTTNQTGQMGRFVGTFELFGGSTPPASTNPPPNAAPNQPVQSVMGQFYGFLSPYHWLGMSVGLVVVLLIAMVVIIARLAPQQYEALLTARRSENPNAGAISYKTTPSNSSDPLPTNQATSPLPSSQQPAPTETSPPISTETSTQRPLPTASEISLPTVSQTPSSPSATNTPTHAPIPEVPTETLIPEVPTYTPIPDTPTFTAIPPTNTPTFTAIPPTNTPTFTTIPPTNTPTFTAIPPTHTPTLTPLPPTPTNTPTFTAIPPTHTPTFTPLPPTNTPTFTPLPPTHIPIQRSRTPTIPPTNTPTHQPTIPPTPLTTCETQNFPAPQLGLQKANDTIDGYRYFLEVTNYWQYTSELFEVAPHLPPCGENPNSSRTWARIYDQDGNQVYGFCVLSEPQNLQLLSFWVSNEQLPAAVYLVLLDRECNKEYRSNLVTLATPTPQSPPSAKPDLVVSSLTVTSFTEERISYSYQITNIGEAPANLDDVSVQALLSEDTIFDPYTLDFPAGGTALGPSPLGQLEPGESFSDSFGADPSGFTPSMQYLVLMVDWNGNVDESNEENNTAATLLPPRTSE